MGTLMRPTRGACCCVCQNKDDRALAVVDLPDGGRATLCGTHALMHRRTDARPCSESELQALFADRRGRRDRRDEGDALGAALTAAFAGERRAVERRRP
jgi:hypothetical protein